MGHYEIRLMFEWGGSCLWGMNAAAKLKYGYADIEHVLPLSDKVKSKLADLSQIHDGALDWSDPAGPSPWLPEKFERFEIEANTVLQEVQAELGDQFRVWYSPLGGPMDF